MAQNTEHFQFIKPDENDYYSIHDQNRNWDRADAIFQEIGTIDGEDFVASGDISNTNIATMDTITEEFPVPGAGESTKTFLGKMKKFAQDFNNFKTGIMTLGMLVNNTETNRADLPAAAGAVFNLQQQMDGLKRDSVSKLNDNIIESQVILHKQSGLNIDSYYNAPLRILAEPTPEKWTRPQIGFENRDQNAASLYLDLDDSFKYIDNNKFVKTFITDNDLAIKQFSGDINNLRDSDSNKSRIYYILKESVFNAPNDMSCSALLKISCFGQFTLVEIVDENKNCFHWAGWDNKSITSSSWSNGLNGRISDAAITGEFVGNQNLKAAIMANYVHINGSITLGKHIPAGTSTVIGRCYTEELPLIDSYFSFLIPDGRNCLASIGTDGNITLYNYTGSQIIANSQLFCVGWSWLFK